MTITNVPVPDPREAFEVLRDIAADAANRGRLAFAASAKPLMRQKLGYDEAALDFATFRDLLSAAERAGFVKLRFVLGGDVELTPGDPPPLSDTDPTSAHVTPAEVREPPRSEQRVYIRRDFWQTFVNPGEWWYDPATDAVVPATSALGQTGLIAMPPFEDEEQTAWVDEFVATLPAPRQEALKPALAGALTAASKTSLLRGQPQTVRSHWFDFVSGKVADRFEAWRGESQMSVRIEAPPRPSRKDDVQNARAGRSVSDPNREDLVRRRLHTAIERMPLSELLRLSVPVEFLIDG